MLRQIGQEKVNQSDHQHRPSAAGKELGINTSKLLEERLVEVMQEKKRQKWLEENGAALDEYGRFLEEKGLFSDSVRRF